MDDARRATTQRARCDEIGFGRNPSRAIRCFLRATYNFHLLSMFAFLSCVSHTWIYTRKPFRAYFSPALFASYHRSSAQPSSASSSPAEYTRHVHHSSRTLHLAVLPPPHRILLFSCLSSSSRQGLMTTTREYDGRTPPRSVGVVENLPMPMRGFHDGGDGVEICGGGDQLERFRG